MLATEHSLGHWMAEVGLQTWGKQWQSSNRQQILQSQWPSLVPGSGSVPHRSSGAATITGPPGQERVRLQEHLRHDGGFCRNFPSQRNCEDYFEGGNVTLPLVTAAVELRCSTRVTA